MHVRVKQGDMMIAAVNIAAFSFGPVDSEIFQNRKCPVYTM